MFSWQSNIWMIQSSIRVKWFKPGDICQETESVSLSLFLFYHSDTICNLSYLMVCPRVFLVVIIPMFFVTESNGRSRLEI